MRETESLRPLVTGSPQPPGSLQGLQVKPRAVKHVRESFKKTTAVWTQCSYWKLLIYKEKGGTLGGTDHTGAAQVPSCTQGCGRALSAREGGARKADVTVQVGVASRASRRNARATGDTRAHLQRSGCPCGVGRWHHSHPKTQTFPCPSPADALPAVLMTVDALLSAPRDRMPVSPMTACPCPPVSP